MAASVVCGLSFVELASRRCGFTGMRCCLITRYAFVVDGILLIFNGSFNVGTFRCLDLLTPSFLGVFRNANRFVQRLSLTGLQRA